MLNDKGEEVGIIYGWYNTKSGKWYIGQTVNPEGRFNCHIRLSLNNDNTYFHRALRKYSLENFASCKMDNKELLTIKCDVHAASYLEEMELYNEKVSKFLNSINF